MNLPRLSFPTLPFSLYRGGPTDHIILYRNGRVVGSGLGASFWVWPWHTLVRVPQAEQSYAFTDKELSSDTQDMTVTGEVRVRFMVDTLAKRRDLRVDPKSDAPLTDDLRKIEAEVRSLLPGYVRRQVVTHTMRELLTKTDQVRDAMLKEMTADAEVFASLGVELVGLVVTAITPTNSQLRQALEAETREQVMAAADRAMHDRRMKSAEADRAVKTYEIATQQTVEEGRTALLAVQNANLVSTAEAEAKASTERLAPFRNVAPEVLLALALQEAAKNGIGTLNVSPELLTALRTAMPAQPA